MRHFKLYTTVWLLAASLGQSALIVPASAQTPGSPQTEGYSPETTVSGQALVGVRGGEQAQTKAAIASYGGRVREYYAPGNYFIVETPTNASQWSQRVKADPRVRYAEVDQILSADLTASDPRYEELWGMKQINMPLAWDQHTGSKSVVVGVIDTGVAYNHEDLKDQMWTNPDEIAGNGVDDDRNGYVDDVYGIDCRNNDSNPLDDNDHGSHVAGTIGAEANNSTGVAGVNWAVSVMALKFLGSSGSGYISDAIECLDYAIGEKADLTNNSWGGGGFSQAMADAINRARGADQLFVAAAGNSSVNNDSSPHYPSSYASDNIVSVASSTSTDLLSSFSNYGATSVDIAAPGSSILSTLRSGYGTMSGTSMAAPHVAGAAALLAARNPTWAYGQLRDRLYSTAKPVEALEGKVATGARLDVGAALVSEQPAEAAPVVRLTSPTSSSVYGVVSVAASVVDDVPASQVEFFVDGNSLGIDKTAADGWGISWHTDGLSGSHQLTAEATDSTSAPQTGTSPPLTVTVDNAVVHIGDLDTRSIWSSGTKYWKGTVTILVHDAFDRPVVGALASGRLSSGSSISCASPTDASGTCTATTGSLFKNTSSLVFTVSGVSISGRRYVAGDNHDPESDSNGTSITLRRPA